MSAHADALQSSLNLVGMTSLTAVAILRYRAGFSPAAGLAGFFLGPIATHVGAPLYLVGLLPRVGFWATWSLEISATFNATGFSVATIFGMRFALENAAASKSGCTRRSTSQVTIP